MRTFRRLIVPYFVWMALMLIIPMLLIAFYAFTSNQAHDIIQIRFTLEHFRKFFDPVFLSVLVKSLQIAFVTTVICLILGYPLAFIISRQSEKMQTMLILMVTIPMWINMLIRTYAWMSL
ncbi:MAG TPA: ABC transporter permease, partial [Erysipelothrix sp.]|nr:ABC transporter permease [Erysipelothrix sp.]